MALLPAETKRGKRDHIYVCLKKFKFNGSTVYNL